MAMAMEDKMFNPPWTAFEENELYELVQDGGGENKKTEVDLEAYFAEDNNLTDDNLYYPILDIDAFLETEVDETTVASLGDVGNQYLSPLIPLIYDTPPDATITEYTSPVTCESESMPSCSRQNGKRKQDIKFRLCTESDPVSKPIAGPSKKNPKRKEPEILETTDSENTKPIIIISEQSLPGKGLAPEITPSVPKKKTVPEKKLSDSKKAKNCRKYRYDQKQEKMNLKKKVEAQDHEIRQMKDQIQELKEKLRNMTVENKMLKEQKLRSQN